MAARTWTCQRRSGGARCGHVNPKRRQICERCGKRRPATKQVAHRKVLEQPYEVFVIANGGSENCGICGRPPPGGGKHRRDHEHKGDGLARGLLCWTCNLALRDFATPEWLRAAADYLERAERRRGMNLAAFVTMPGMSQPQQPQPQPQPDPNAPDQPAQQPQPDQAPGEGGQPAPENPPQPTTTQGG